MKLSIVTTSYNAEKYIKETIESVIYQRGNFDIEYIIVDAYSKDKTPEIITKYLSKWKNNELEIKCNSLEMQYIREPDNGMYDGISKGFERATGEIVAYINADDFYMPNAFAVASEIFENNKKTNWITGTPQIYNENSNVISSFSLPYKYKQEAIRKGVYGRIYPYIQQESTFWRNELLDKIDLKKLRKYLYAGDFYLWHSFAQYCNLVTVNCPLSGFRSLDNQKSKNTDAYKKEFEEIADKISFIENLRFTFNKKQLDNTPYKKIVKKIKNTSISYDLSTKKWL